MSTHWLIWLGIGLAVFIPVAAGETETSYSLNELRILARSAHPTLESAQAATEAASGALQQAQAYPNPGLAVGFGRGRPRGGGPSGPETTIELVQPIEMPGTRRWRTRAAELRATAVEFDRVQAETVVDSTVSRLAYTVLLERRRAEIAKESVEVAFRLHELLERRAELGESSPLEALKARSEWFARRREVVQAENAHATARSTLDLFCGGGLPDGFVITETLEGPGAIALPTDLVDRLRKRNPLVLRSVMAVEEAEVRMEIARKEKFPAIDVIAAYESELDRTAASVGVGLTIPLWNRNKGKIAASAAEQTRAAADTRTIALELEGSLEQSMAAYRGALAAIRLHRDGWTATARQALEISTFSFENGEASLLDVLDSQRAYLGVRSAEAESWAALALARVDIELLLAGPLVPEDTDETR